MNTRITNGQFVCPGDLLVPHHQRECFDACQGCYVMEGSGDIRASIVGTVLLNEDIIQPGQSRSKISILSLRSRTASETVIDVGDKVICRVVRLSMHQANVEIISVGDCPLQQFPKGIIRREDVSIGEVEKLVMHECFRPCDIVRGVIISLGDSRQYYLSTSEVESGVLYAKNLLTGNSMTPISQKVRLDRRIISLYCYYHNNFFTIFILTSSLALIFCKSK